VSATAAPYHGEVRGHPDRLAVDGIRNPRSAGIARYAALLAEALADEHVDYSLADRAVADGPAHFHVANSSRALLRQARGLEAPFCATVHDVVPRTPALRPFYRALVYPALARRARAVIVHTTFAADMLARHAERPRRLEVIPHPAARPRDTDRSAARCALGWPEDELVAVLPGVIKRAKLAREAVAAVAHEPGWRLALAGRLADRRVAREAQESGALLLADPDTDDYERAIVAADCVLCLRAGSVGETNGPLLDALGACRAVLATSTGSIPEVAGGAVRFCDGTVPGIRAGLARLRDKGDRAALESAARERRAALTWRASGALHAELFREVFDV
jgi:glycosyltransferase involved in cell wall biosynthesis